MIKYIAIFIFFVSSGYSHADTPSCQLPSALTGYVLFAQISGMDYKTRVDAMSFRQLFFSSDTVKNVSLLTGEYFTAFYIYKRFFNDIAFIEVYQDRERTNLYYRDLLFCETNVVGKIIFTPHRAIPEIDFMKKQVTAKYVLKKPYTN